LAELADVISGVVSTRVKNASWRGGNSAAILARIEAAGSEIKCDTVHSLLDDIFSTSDIAIFLGFFLGMGGNNKEKEERKE